MPRSKRTTFIILAIVGVISAALLGVGYYLQTKLATVTHGPDVELVPTMRSANEPDFAMREVDLGYLKVSLPVAIVGEPQGVNGSLAVQIESDDGTLGVAFFPPMDLESSGMNDVARRFAALGAIDEPDWYGMAKTALYTESFDLWDVPAIGIGESQTRLQLLLLKHMLVAAARQVRLIETGGLNFVVKSGEDHTIIEINDPSRGSLQTILINDASKLAEQVIDAVAATYMLQTSDLSSEAVASRLQQAGIEFQPPPEEEIEALTDEEIVERMNAVAEEIRKRRAAGAAESQEPVRSVIVPVEESK